MKADFTRHVWMKHGCVWSLAFTMFVATALAQTAEELATQISQRPAFQHPIIFVGEQTPALAESQELWFDLTLMRAHGVPTGLAALENFVTNHLDSPWTPSLRNNLAHYYRQNGRYSLALEHWEAAWHATKNLPSGNGKKVADFAFAHWTRLLASLGRRETMLALFQETGDRLLDAGRFNKS
jgi:tetratricopeptide (TPR) repeat protein